jgi:hypothetical protein
VHDPKWNRQVKTPLGQQHHCVGICLSFPVAFHLAVWRREVPKNRWLMCKASQNAITCVIVLTVSP